MTRSENAPLCGLRASAVKNETAETPVAPPIFTTAVPPAPREAVRHDGSNPFPQSVGHSVGAYVRLQVYPFQSELSAEPVHLTFRELARALFHQRDGVGQRTFAPQKFGDLAIADGLHRGSILLQSQSQQSLGFLHQTAREHCVHASVDAGAQVIARA